MHENPLQYLFSPFVFNIIYLLKRNELKWPKMLFSCKGKSFFTDGSEFDLYGKKTTKSAIENNFLWIRVNKLVLIGVKSLSRVKSGVGWGTDSR